MLFHLDANAVNAKQRDPDLMELERLEIVGIVSLQYSEVAYSEARHGSSLRAKKVELHTWAGLSKSPEFTADWREKIANAVFPNLTLSASQENDVEILMTAKMAGAILVTNDGASKGQPKGILGSKRELEGLGIQVVTPSEAVALAKAGSSLISSNS